MASKKDGDVGLILKAMQFAAHKHQDQRRRRRGVALHQAPDRARERPRIIEVRPHTGFTTAINSQKEHHGQVPDLFSKRGDGCARWRTGSVLELPSRDEAIAWAARMAKACRCDQELRVFGFDPQS